MKTITPAFPATRILQPTFNTETRHARNHLSLAMSPDLIGWLASAILVATLSRQIWTQAHDKSATGVSHWLFAGQIASSLGFIAYSWMLENRVFIVTNSIILMTAVVGQVVMSRKRK